MPDLPIIIIQNSDGAEFFSARYGQKDFKRWIAYDALAQQVLKNRGIEFTDESFYLSGQMAELKKIQTAAHRMACDWFQSLPLKMFPGRDAFSRPASLSVRAFNYYFQSTLCAYFFLKRIREVEGACELWIAKTGNAPQHRQLRDSARPLPELLSHLNDTVWNFNIKWQPEAPARSRRGSEKRPESAGGLAGYLIALSWMFKKTDFLFSGNSALLAPVAKKLKAAKGMSFRFVRRLHSTRELPLLFMRDKVLFDGRPTFLKTIYDWNITYGILKKNQTFIFDGIDFLKVFGEKIKDFYEKHAKEFDGSYKLALKLLKAIRPRYVVVDEDVTEFHRTLITAARELHIKTLVIAHGLPGAPWGFMPLAADHIAVWGEYSIQPFLDWKLEKERILVTGCPKYDALKPVEIPSKDLKLKISAARNWNPENPLVLVIPGKFRMDPFDRFDGSGSTSSETLKTAHIFLETAKKLPQVNFIFKFRADLQENKIFKGLMDSKDTAPKNIDFTHEGLALDYLAASDLVFNNCSSACLESVLMKRPVVAMNYAYYPNVFPFYETGLGAIVRSEEETFQICKKLADGELPLQRWVESQEKLVKPFLFARDGEAASRVTEFLLKRLNVPASSDLLSNAAQPQLTNS